jgi:anti-sigma B factor antagonist
MAANPQPQSQLDLIVEETPAETGVRCIGRITSNNAELLRETVRPLTASNKNVALDLTGVDYMDSSGLGTVVGLFVSARRVGRNLRLINANERVKELFSITKLGQLFMEGRDPDYPRSPFDQV